MANHYGRTELAKILALLALSVLLLTLPGWAYDFSEAARITNMETGVTSGAYYYIAPPTQDEVRGDEVAALLERCLEYVDDNDSGFNGYGFFTEEIEYEVAGANVSESLKMKEVAKKVKEKLDALDRETKLRRDIEAVLGKLRKGE